MRSLNNRVAVVTGAASGIGRATAEALAKRGARLAVSDVNEKELAATVKSLTGRGTNAIGYTFDVSKRDEVHAHADNVLRDFGEVHIVINNAGVGLSATVEEMTYDELEWLMGINFWGVVYGTKAFLPHLKAADEGHIVNISSVFGIIGVPTQSAYNAAKFAVRGFTEALRQELEIEGARVGVTSVHPGGVKTNIARDSRVGENVPSERRPNKETLARNFEKMAKTTPAEAAEAIIRGIERNSPRVLIGPDARVIDTVQRALPTTYQQLVKRWAQRQNAKIKS